MTVARPKRADAVRNRERVLAAAETVLAERGLAATIPEVAAAAGVGKGTVYRSFPTKEHLVAAVAGERLSDFAARCDEAAAAPDPVGALEAVLADALRRQAEDRLLVGVLAVAARLPQLVEARERVHAALERLVAAGRATGALREGVSGDDVAVLIGGISRVLLERGELDAASWERFAGLIVSALRA
ncbi:MAG TPA: helix-turn-helix domain-containing protein [Capillimicrobium sp.]